MEKKKPAGSRKHSDEKMSEKQQLARIVGLNIKRVRESRGLSQGELSRRVGLSSSYVSLIESGQRAGVYTVVLRIAKNLSISPEELYSKEPLNPTRHSALRFYQVIGASALYAYDSSIEQVGWASPESPLEIKVHDYLGGVAAVLSIPLSFSISRREGSQLMTACQVVEVPGLLHQPVSVYYRNAEGKPLEFAGIRPRALMP